MSRSRLTIVFVTILAACLFSAPASAMAAAAMGKACTVSGCHLIDPGYSIAETVTATTAETATYRLTFTGTTEVAWAVFGGPHMLASGNGMQATFVAGRGLDYDVFVVGRHRGFSTGGVSKHLVAPVATLPSTATPDVTPPVVTSNAASAYSGAAGITVSAVDAAPGWGVAYIFYSLDGSRAMMHRAVGTANSSVALTVPASAVGAHTLEYWAQDRAGNVSAVRRQTFNIRQRVRVSLGAPIAPTHMRSGNSYAVHGFLRPRHESGSSPVRLYRQRLVSGVWRDEGYVTATVSDYSSYSKYVASLRLPSAGRWRLRAFAPADSQHLQTWSAAYDYVTVR